MFGLRNVCVGGAETLLLQDRQFQADPVRRGEALRRGPEDFFEFSAKMGVGRKIKLRGRGFAGISLRDKLLGEPALQLTQPLTRRALKMLLENPL